MIAIRGFSGERPRISAALLPQDAAQSAAQCNFAHGSLDTYREPQDVQQLVLTGEHKTIFRYLQGDGTERWLEWVEDVDVVRGPIASDTTKRTYFTGTDVPRVFDDTQVAAGSGEFPQVSYKLGVPAPTGAPTATLGAGGSGSARDLAYVYTFVRKWSTGAVDESAPSPASNIVSALPGQTVTVDDFDAAPADRGISHIRIYRASTGDFQFVTEITVATTTHDDSILDTALGEVLPSEIWDAPPDDLVGLVSLPNGSFAGFHGKEVCVSVPYQVHAFPEDYRIVVPDSIVGISSLGNVIVVLTEGFPYLVDAQSPEILSTTKGLVNYPCLSKRGIVSTEVGVLYPTYDGLARVSLGGAVDLLTKPYVTTEEWENFHPSTMRAKSYRGMYFCFYHDTGDTGPANNGVLINYREDRGMVGLFGGVHALYADETNGNLYYVATDATDSTNHIYRWDALVGRVAYLWRSKKFVEREPTNMAAVMILADWDGALSQADEDAYNDNRDAIIAANQAAFTSNDSGAMNGSVLNHVELNGDDLPLVPPTLDDIVGMTFKLYADGTLVATLTVEDDLPRSLPAGYMAKQFEVELQGQIKAYEVRVAPSKLDLANA